MLLDISYNKLVSDEGFAAFNGKKLPIQTLQVTSLGDLVSGKGLAFIIDTCQATLRHYSAANMRQDYLKAPEYGVALGKCFKLESLDVAGCRGLGDDFLQKITSGELV